MNQSETNILREIHELKTILARVIGTADLPEGERFSIAALDEAAKFYHQMTIERGEWVPETQLEKYLGPVPYSPGNLVRKTLVFTNWIKRGHTYLYAKQDLITLGQELKARNINLKRYQEFLADKAAFDKKAAQRFASVAKSATTSSRSAQASKSATAPTTSAIVLAKSKGKPFNLSKGIKNITTTDIPTPDPETVRQDFAQLKEAFKTGNFAAYIDIYKGTHAMLKHMYRFEKYLEPGLKRRCPRWCDDFNYANHALEAITGKKEKFTTTDQTANDPTAIEL